MRMKSNVQQNGIAMRFGFSGPALFAVGLAAALISPRSAATLVPLGLLVVVWSTVGKLTRTDLARDQSMAWSWFALVGWALASSSWSPVPLQSVTKAVYGLLLIALVVAFWRSVRELETATRHAVICVSIVIVGLGLLLNTIEILSGQVLYRSWMQWVEGLRQSTKHLTVVDGVVVWAGDVTNNRRTLIATLLLVPGIAGATALLPRKWWPFAAAGFSVAAVAILAGTHESSKLAIALGLAVAVLCALSVRWTRRVVAAGWLAATLLILPAITFAYESGVHRSSWLFASAKHRVVIWNNMVGLSYESLPLGIGADATEEVQERLDEAGVNQLNPDRKVGKMTAPHPHNAFLQVWYELGIVGAGLFAMAGLVLLRRIGTLPPGLQVVPLTQFVVVAAMLSTSYSLWQPWLMAVIALSTSMTLLAVKISER